MKEYTEKEILNKAEAYCSAVERCPSDVEAKLKGWGASPETVAAVMAHLFKESFQPVGQGKDSPGAAYEGVDIGRDKRRYGRYRRRRV